MKRFLELACESRSLSGDADIISTTIDTARKLTNLYDKKVSIVEKYDGIKMSIAKQSHTGEVIKDFVVAYHRGNKSFVVYGDEYDEDEKRGDGNRSNGQYQSIWDVLKKNEDSLKEMPVGTLVKLEFIANKDTLRVQYKHRFVSFIVGFSYSAKIPNGEYSPDRTGTFIVADTKVSTNLYDIEELAKKYFGYNPESRQEDIESNAPTFFPPKHIFEGRLRDFLTKLYGSNETTWFPKFQETISKYQSELGGDSEGFIIFEGSRSFKIKNKGTQDNNDGTHNDKEEEKKDKIRNYFYDWLKNDEGLREAIYTTKNLKLAFKIVKEKLKAEKLDSDLFDFAMGYTKGLISNQLPQNQYVLYVGRFSPMTNGHLAALKAIVGGDYKINGKTSMVPKNITLVIINRKNRDYNNPFSADTKMAIIKDVLKYNGLDVFVHPTSFNDGAKLGTILKTKVHGIVTHVMAGAERINGYKEQLGDSVKYLVLNRDADSVREGDTSSTLPVLSFDSEAADVSATKLREAIRNNNRNDFNKYFPKLPKERMDYWYETLRAEVQQ